MIVNVENVGAVGIIKGIPPHELPPEAWSDGDNVTMQDRSVYKVEGMTRIFHPPRIKPQALWPVQAVGSNFWVYCGLQNVFATDMSATHSDITRTSSTYTAPVGSWSGGLLGGILILNNTFDIPQMWGANPSLATKLQNLSNWQSTVRCKILRPFRQYLVALNISKSGVAYPHMVKWSHPADPGAVPISWDETDATKDAGEFPLAEAGGPLVDCLPLRDANIIYKEDATFAMYLAGPPKIFGFRKLFGDTGILAPRCVQDIGGRHAVVTRGDIIVHDGQVKESILTARQRRALFNSLGVNAGITSYTIAFPDKQEFWFCYPDGTDLYPSKIFVWNWRDKTCSYRSVVSGVGLADMKIGVVDPGSGQSWDSVSSPWDDGSADPWDSRTFQPTRSQALAAEAVNDRFFWVDTGTIMDGSAYRTFVERLGIGLTGADRQGNPKVDITKWKFCRRVWLKMKANGHVRVSVGAQEHPDAPVYWNPSVAFDPNTMDFVECDVSGRLLALRIDVSGDSMWSLDGYAMEIEVTSEF